MQDDVIRIADPYRRSSERVHSERVYLLDVNFPNTVLELIDDVKPNIFILKTQHIYFDFMRT